MKSFNMRALSAALVSVFCATALFAQEDYGTWHKYRDITINTTNSGGGANVPTSQTNFPVLVRLTSTHADVFTDAMPNGTDIRFTLPDGVTRLPHQRERYNAGGQLAEFWVLVPTVTGNDNTVIRMYWGRPPVADSSNGAQVFDTSVANNGGYRSVWHLGDTTGIDPRPNATVYSALTATPVNFSGGYTPRAGIIALADSMNAMATPGGHVGGNTDNGIAQYMRINQGTATNAYNFPNGAFTATLWAYHVTKSGTYGNNRHFMIQGTAPTGANHEPRASIHTIPGSAGGTAGVALTFHFRYSNTPAAGNPANTTNNNTQGGALQLPYDNWLHVAAVVVRGPARDTLKKYVNGILLGTPTYPSSDATGRLPDTARTYGWLGRSFNQASDSTFLGSLDEVRFANISRTTDWLRLEYQSQKADAHTSGVVTVGSTTEQIPIAINTGKPSLQGFAVRRAGSSMLFTVPQGAGDMRISVSDFQGRTVWSRAVTAGAREISWDGKTQGRKASAGLYLVRLTSADASRANAEIAVRKFTLNP